MDRPDSDLMRRLLANRERLVPLVNANVTVTLITHCKLCGHQKNYAMDIGDMAPQLRASAEEWAIHLGCHHANVRLDMTEKVHKILDGEDA